MKKIRTEKLAQAADIKISGVKLTMQNTFIYHSFLPLNDKHIMRRLNCSIGSML